MGDGLEATCICGADISGMEHIENDADYDEQVITTSYFCLLCGRIVFGKISFDDWFGENDE